MIIRRSIRLALAAGMILSCRPIHAETISTAPLNADDLVRITMERNPQILQAREQYESAAHQIDQAYTPQDPQLTLANDNSPNGMNHPSSKSIGVSESLQFPGKAWLQGDEAHRNAEIARLTYLGAMRDARAQTLTAYYQTWLDNLLTDTAAENASNLDRVLKVAQVAYAANQVTQSDLISAEFDLAQASQTYRASFVTKSNDEAALNLSLGRDPQDPLNLSSKMELNPVQAPMDSLLRQGIEMRQELLEAALTEKNSKTALKLAWMELLPDLNLSYYQTTYPLSAASPNPGIDTKDNTVSLSFNVPIFFWFRQKEDISSAQRLLDASRDNRQLIDLQTRAAIVQLYRSTALAYETALLYRDALIPLARQDFQVTLIAYQSRKVDFITLSGALQRVYQARINYLTAANQFLAGRVALEQAIGAPIPL